VGVSTRGTVFPHVVAAWIGLVVYIVLTQSLSSMPAAKSVVGGVVVGVLTFVATLLVRALATARRTDEWRRG
jgi:hypothetical protein